MATYTSNSESEQRKCVEKLQALDDCKKKNVSDVTLKQSRLSRSKSSSALHLVNPHWNITISNIVPSENIQLGGAIERGSFGVVRRAKWLGAIVAVKVLPAGSINSRQFISFMREVAYATNLRHPFIVATMGVVTDKWNGLIMEVMSWGSLRASLNDPRRRRFFSKREMLKCLRCVCSAGAYLSSVGVIHRDISSKNVFVSTAFDCAKLGDFGISSSLEVHVRDRRDPEYGMRLNDHIEVFAGAPAYKAPELLQQRPIYSEKSDVFALAIVMWEMLTTLWSGIYGAPYADLPERRHIEEAISSGARPPLDATFFGLEEIENERFESLIQLIRRCWSTDPDSRPSFWETYQFFE